MREDAGELVEKRVLTVVCKKPRRHQLGETNRSFSPQLRNCKRNVRRPQIAFTPHDGLVAVEIAGNCRLAFWPDVIEDESGDEESKNLSESPVH